jgi:hypothetical protein
MSIRTKAQLNTISVLRFETVLLFTFVVGDSNDPDARARRRANQHDFIRSAIGFQS